MIGAQTRATQSTVLVVEDEPMLLLVVAETLRDAGYEVWEAPNAQEALAILDVQAEIVLMLTDIKMPGMDGYQLAEASLQKRPELKIMLMTGYSQAPLPRKMADMGISVLQKPFDIDRLPERAAEVLRSPK